MKAITLANPCLQKRNWCLFDKLFFHKHPYPPYIPEGATKLIVGTLPPPRFSTRELKDGDVDFCYGSRDGQLWLILDRIFDLGLLYERSVHAVEQRKEFLEYRGIGICDIVDHAYREKVDASDLGMKEVVLRDLIAILEKYPDVNTLLFTGGNSKNGPEFFFRKLAKQYNIKLKTLSEIVPREYSFQHPIHGNSIKTVSLIAPSGAANRAVGSLSAYKEMKKKHPEKSTIDFRVEQYKIYF